MSVPVRTELAERLPVRSTNVPLMAPSPIRSQEPDQEQHIIATVPETVTLPALISDPTVAADALKLLVVKSLAKTLGACRRRANTETVSRLEALTTPDALTPEAVTAPAVETAAAVTTLDALRDIAANGPDDHKQYKTASLLRLRQHAPDTSRRGCTLTLCAETSQMAPLAVSDMGDVPASAMVALSRISESTSTRPVPA